MMNKNGFTLIELLVVVAIIGVLAAVGVVAYSGYTYGAKVAVAKNNYKQVVKAVTNEMRKCDLGENQVFGFISCTLTVDQRVGALTNNANTAKIQSFFSGMKNPFCGSHHSCAAPNDPPVYTGTPGAPGIVAIESNAVPMGVFIASPVAYYRENTKVELSCTRYPNDPNCWRKFIPIE
tara:strand:+ start:78 stop:611 length:534 start_codon:yes stop_codon:yes gene_type:complete